MIHLFHECGIDLILEFGDTQVLDFNWIGYGPFKTNGNRWEIIDILQELELSSTVKSLTLKVNDQRFSVKDGEENLQVVKFYFLGIVENVDVHLLARCESSLSWLNMEDLIF